MPKLIALTSIHHDGQPYGEGDILDVADAKQADALVSAGAALVQKARAPKAASKTPGTEGAPDPTDPTDPAGTPDGTPDAPAA